MFVINTVCKRLGFLGQDNLDAWLFLSTFISCLLNSKKEKAGTRYRHSFQYCLNKGICIPFYKTRQNFCQAYLMPYEQGRTMSMVTFNSKITVFKKKSSNTGSQKWKLHISAFKPILRKGMNQKYQLLCKFKHLLLF